MLEIPTNTFLIAFSLAPSTFRLIFLVLAHRHFLGYFIAHLEFLVDLMSLKDQQGTEKKAGYETETFKATTFLINHTILFALALMCLHIFNVSGDKIKLSSTQTRHSLVCL
jgi:hypothetical protein